MTRKSARSMTARLALLFAAVVMATFLTVGSYLYRSLGVQLERRDDAELLGKITLTRHLLTEVDSLREIQRAPDVLLNAMLGHDGLLFLVLAADGQVIVQNTRFSGVLPQMSVVSAATAPGMNDIRDWESDAVMRRLVSARGVIGSSGEQVIIVVARDVSERAALLRTYGADLALAAVIGALIASLLGYMTVRNGLRPIDTVARKANEITSRKLDTRLSEEEAPAELRDLTAAFNAMLDRLENGVKRLAGFAADLAHDLRTPVNALMIKTQVALSRPRTADEYRALLESNVEEYEQLARLIESTLFLARADNAQLAVQKESIDAAVACEKVADYYSGVADEAGVRLEVVGSARVCVDPVLFQRAVSNLVSNAVRHTPSGGTVRIHVGDGTASVEVRVENSGPGIPAEQIERVFDRYFRGDASRSDAGGSAGLGLAIVRAIMSLHQGSAAVTSSDAGPTRFTLSFPEDVDSTSQRPADALTTTRI